MTTVKIQIWDSNDQLVAGKEFKDVEIGYAQKMAITRFLYENIE